jgi:sulfur carrier protein ThiS adenylyltransferase
MFGCGFQRPTQFGGLPAPRPNLGGGRTLVETSRILVMTGEVQRYHCPTTPFGTNEGEAGHCTARSTVYTSNFAAGLMVHQFARWSRGQPVDKICR